MKDWRGFGLSQRHSSSSLCSDLMNSSPVSASSHGSRGFLGNNVQHQRCTNCTAQFLQSQFERSWDAVWAVNKTESGRLLILSDVYSAENGTKTVYLMFYLVSLIVSCKCMLILKFDSSNTFQTSWNRSNKRLWHLRKGYYYTGSQHCRLLTQFVCILFVFTFYTESRLLWNWGCRHPREQLEASSSK